MDPELGCKTRWRQSMHLQERMFLVHCLHNLWHVWFRILWYSPPSFVLYMLFWQEHHTILCCRNQYTADPKFNFSSPHPQTSYLFFHPVWGGKGKGSSGITFWSQTQVRSAKWRKHARKWTNKLVVKDGHVWDTNYYLCWANLHADLLLPASSPLSASEIRLDLRFSLCLYAQGLEV